MAELRFNPEHALTPLLTAHALITPLGKYLERTAGCVWEPTAVTELFFAAMRELTGKLPDPESDRNYGMVDGDELYHLVASLQFMAEEEAEEVQDTQVVAVVLSPHLDQAVSRHQEGDAPESAWVSPLLEDEDEGGA